MKGLELRSISTWLALVALIMVLYQLLYTQVYLWDPHIHRIIHLSLAFCVVCLSIAAKRGGRISMRLLMLFLVVVVIGTTAELIIVYPETRDTLVLPPTGSMIGDTIGLVLALAFT